MGLIDVLSIELTQKKLSYTETTSSIIYELFYNVSALMIVYVRIYATRITNNGKGEREAPRTYLRRGLHGISLRYHPLFQYK